MQILCKLLCGFLLLLQFSQLHVRVFAERVTELQMFLQQLNNETIQKSLHFQELTPDSMRFAHWRCAQDMQNVSDSLRALWKENIYPNNSLTHCYVKCLLSKMGLIDLMDRGLNVKKLLSHWHKFNVKPKEKCHKVLLEEPAIDGRCYVYYTRWMALLQSSCKDLLKFWSFKAEAEIPPFKLPEQTAISFCAISGSEKWKQYEHFHVLDEEFHRRALQIPPLIRYLLECIFKNFHYFDAYGRLDTTEINKSYSEARAVTPRNTAAINYCSHLANMKYVAGYWNMSIEFAECMMKKSIDFIFVFYERNRLTSVW